VNLAAVILLATAAVAGAVFWRSVDPRRHELSTRSVALAAAVPAVLLAGAALCSWIGSTAGDTVLAMGTVAGVLAAVTGGGLVATAVLRFADRIPVGGSDIDTAELRIGTVSDPQTLRGGAWIGALERIAVSVTLLAGWPEGLAVVLAVKGLGRYPELRRPAAAERFIVGTFASVLWAVAAVGAAVALRH
jgi:hypothetical protein